MASRETNKDLKKRIEELEQILDKRTIELTREISDYVHIRIDLDKRTRELNQRLKELNCMLQLSRLSDREEMPFSNYIKEALRIIVTSFEHAEIAMAEIKLGGEIYQTPGFFLTEHKIGRGLMEQDKMIGYLTVCLKEERQEKDHGPFTTAEKNLLIVSTRYLVQIIKRKRYEDELQKFRELVSQSPNMILITDDKGKVEFLNQQFTDILGFSLKELKDQVIGVEPKDSKGNSLLEAIVNTIFNHETFQGEFKVQDKYGKDIWVRGTISPIINVDSSRSFVSVFSDISEEVELKRINWEQQERYRMVMDHIPVAILLSDEDGKLIFVNQHARNILNLPIEQIQNKGIEEIFPLEGKETIRIIKQIFHDKKSILQDSVYTINGKLRIFEINRLPVFDNKGEVTYVMSIAKEITDKKQMDTLLNFQHTIDSLQSISDTFEKSLNILFDNLFKLDWVDVGGLYIFNKNRDMLELVYHRGLSENFIRSSSRYPTDSPNVKLILGRKSLFHSSEHFLPNSSDTIEDEGITFLCVLPLVYREKVIGSLNLASKTRTSISDFDKLIIESITGRVANLIELVKTQEDLKQTNDELAETLKSLKQNRHMLIQKSRLESLGELAAGLAHEINQPLAVISLAMENVEIKLKQGKVEEKYLISKFGSISQNIHKIRNLIDHFRVFSRDQQQIILERIDVNNTILEALSLIREQLRNHRINVELDLGKKLGFAIGNTSRLEQVFLNLVSNSRDALDEMEKNFHTTGVSKEIKITSRKVKDQIIITVRDNGSGIKPENIEKVFDPFFTTKPVGKGTGLGLAIVYGIIREMKGTIEAKSVPGKYTELTVRLPAHTIIKKKLDNS